MGNFNKVLLLGNLTRDVEMRYTQGGTAIAKLGLAVNRKYAAQSGEMKEEVTYVDCTAFGKTAETLGKFVTKGRPLFIEGRLQYSTWEDKESGAKRNKLDVVIEGFQFVDSGGSRGAPRADEGEGQAPRRPQAQSGGQGGAAPEKGGEQVDYGDVPF